MYLALLEASAQSSQDLDWERVIYVGVICAFVVWLTVFPVGKLLEEYTRERTVRVIWVLAMICCGTFFFLAMSGVGETLMYLVERDRTMKAEHQPSQPEEQEPDQSSEASEAE